MVTDGDHPAASRPPRGLKTAGKRLWKDVQDRYELETHEELLLLEMCRTADVLDKLARMIEADDGAAGWAIVESRQQKIAFARLSAALRLPAGEDGDHQAGAKGTRRPQRKTGVRGVYLKAVR